ncbi:hypothetical protein FQN54_008456 [Arachnomyces sp. PD_36]|nr:hypothetical protein FQN54_008456 [Arachnomyces sp. PD_36]
MAGQKRSIDLSLAHAGGPASKRTREVHPSETGPDPSQSRIDIYTDDRQAPRGPSPMPGPLCGVLPADDNVASPAEVLSREYIPSNAGEDIPSNQDEDIPSDEDEEPSEEEDIPSDEDEDIPSDQDEEIPSGEDEDIPSDEDDEDQEHIHDDTIGDSERIPGPDDHDIDDEDPSDKVPDKSVVDDPSEPAPRIQSFERTLRALLESLIQNVKSIESFTELKREDRPVTFGFWCLLQRVSVPFLMDLYMPAIPAEVQRLFEKKAWSQEDFLSLPAVNDDERQGIYGDFATGNIRHQNDIGCDAYIGSSKCLRKRVLEHLQMARKSTEDLSRSSYRYSRHYQQVCRPDVQANFRRLAAFSSPIHNGYLLLLESAFIILFNTYQHHGYVTRYASGASWKLTGTVRMGLNLPTVSWKGMNAASPLYQGFINTSAKSISPCRNEHCGVTTRPKRNSRASKDIGNPLGGYICGGCHGYRYHHGNQLPTSEQVELRCARREHRVARAARVILTCEGCKFVEGSAYMSRVSPKLINEGIVALLCGYCAARLGQTVDPKPLDTHYQRMLDTLVKLNQDRQNKLPVICYKCEKDESEYAYRFCMDPEALKPRCRPCAGLPNSTCTPKSKLIQDAYNKLRQDRQDSTPIICHQCQKVERLLLGDRSTRFRINSVTAKPQCRACYETPTGSSAFYEARYKYNQDRANGVPIACHQCQKVEDLSGKWKSNKKFRIDPTVLKPQCRACRTTPNRTPESARTISSISSPGLDEARAKYEQNRANGVPIHCHQCQRLEDLSAKWHSKFAMDPIALKPWCNNCYQKYKRGSFSVLFDEAKAKLEQDRANGVSIVCYSCTEVEKIIPGKKASQFLVNRKALKPFCTTCLARSKSAKPAKRRSKVASENVAKVRAIAHVKQDRENGVPVICYNCTKVERVDPEKPSSRFKVNSDVLKPWCSSCSSKAQSTRPQKPRIFTPRGKDTPRGKAGEKLKQDRKNGAPIHCYVCRKAEQVIAGKQSSRFFIGQDVLEPYCTSCKVREWRSTKERVTEGQKRE